MSIEIPQKTVRRWSGPYLGNYYGSLFRTFNVDLENSAGHITLSRQFKTISDSSVTNMTNLGLIDAFIRSNADNTDRWWALNQNGRLAKSDSVDLPNDTWAEDALANTPTPAKDFTIHEKDSDSAQGEDRLLVTTDTDIAMLNDTATNAWNASWWATTQGHAADSALRSGVPHPIEYFPLMRMSLIGDANFIHIIDKNLASTVRRLILPPYLQVEGIFVTAYRAWILCSGKQGHNGAIVEWDGSSSTYNRIHDAKSIFPLSGVDFNGVPIVINNKGTVLEFDGNSFSNMERNGQKVCLPMFEEIGNMFHNAIFLRPRGMTTTEDGLVYINLSEPDYPSRKQMGGIWCLDPEQGRLYSKHSLNLGGDTDYGQQAGITPGAIKSVNAVSSTSSYLLAGGKVNSSYTSTVVSRIWSLNRSYSSTVRRGYFITQYVPADGILDAWDTIWLKLSAFKSTSDIVIIKARGVNPLLDANQKPLEKTIDWTSTTTFTVTLASGDDQLAVGDEVELESGKNAGALAHITTISGAHAALQTITIDETLVHSSGKSLCRFDRWKKLGVINDTSKYTVPQNIGITSSFIQFKVELRGPATDFDVKSLIINPETQQRNKK